MNHLTSRPTEGVLVLTPMESSIATFSDEFRLTPETTTEPDVILDMSRVEFLTSSGLGQILGLTQRLQVLGRQLSIVNLHPSIDRVFEVTKLNRMIPVRMAATIAAVGAIIPSVEGEPSQSTFSPDGRDESEMNTLWSITDDDRRFAADFEYANEQLARGEFDQYAGQFVGIYNQHVAVVGDRELQIRQEFEDIQGIDGSLLAVKWVEGNEVR